ncbi:MAG: recombinase family protein, partial [Brevundimonas sp.]|nr:recombinase family protein [Brevundimonas sp.]
FARIVEIFDKYGVSFVSVTQAFNTTTSMGRLTLNVLLSFAQFEREVTGERIRDKIAASKKKGLWMGGCPPLGYDPDGRKLKLNETEAELVRHIFERFLALKSVRALSAELKAEGRVSKSWTATTWNVLGGVPFDAGALYHLLKNPTYLGMVPHKDKAYPSTHPAIIDQAVFDQAQAQLAGRAVRRRTRRKGQAEPASALLSLKGRLFDCDGGAMTPSHAYGRRGGAHRYYISSSVNRGNPQRRPDGLYRLPALPAERWVIETLHRLTPDHDPLEVLARMEVHEGSVQLALKASALSEDERTLPLAIDRMSRRLQEGERVHQTEDAVWVHIPRRLKFRGGRAWLSGDAPRYSRLSLPLANAVRRAHALRDASADADGVLQQAPPTVHERGLIRLVWLAPDLQAALLEGRQKTGLCLEDLRGAPIPLCWDDQRRLLAG